MIKRYLQMVLRQVLWVFTPPKPMYTVSQEQALSIARTAVEQLDLPWDGRVDISRSHGTWHIMTNREYSGGNVVIDINGSDGTVVNVQYFNR